MMLKTLVLVGFTFLGLTGCASAQVVEPAWAQAAVTRAWQTQQHGVWEIDWPAAPVGGPLTVEIWRAGDRYRLEILEASAPALIGRTLIFDGERAWRYNRFEAGLPETAAEARLSPVTDALTVIEQLLSQSPAGATQQLVRLRHSGPAQKVQLTFKSDDSLTVWIDEETGLPVRIHFSVASQQAALEARDVELLPNPAVGLFEGQPGE